MDVSEQEVKNLLKKMVDDAIALAIVTKDGSVGYAYANNVTINYDASDAAEIIATIAKLNDQKTTTEKIDEK